MSKERDAAFREIETLQEEYVNKLIGLINNPEYSALKTINFTSPTGTGKTRMMGKVINKLPDCYFIITTLSKGQLHMQIREMLKSYCPSENYYVYGSADYKINSRLDAKDIIHRIPEGTRCIWLRDEGHIKTNRYDELLQNVCFKVINFSATNSYSDIECNFTSTMMLRTVVQATGSPEDAIAKLLDIKKSHANVASYNPCAIFRLVAGNNELYQEIIHLCKKYGLNYIDLNDDDYVMAELCKDDNIYDVIINKYKIVEGIDIRRAHVLYMDNKPNNNATTIQAIGRCRRNALLYRTDVDILDPQNEKLLEQTRECYVYYRVSDAKTDTDENGELQLAFCNYISCEALKVGSVINVTNGQLKNGLHMVELQGCSGQFTIVQDPDTGFNIVDPLPSNAFYEEQTEQRNYYVYTNFIDFPEHNWAKKKILLDDITKIPAMYGHQMIGDVITDDSSENKGEPTYCLFRPTLKRETVAVDNETISYFKHRKQELLDRIPKDVTDTLISDISFDIDLIRKENSLAKKRWRGLVIPLAGVIRTIENNNALSSIQKDLLKRCAFQKEANGEKIEYIERYIAQFIETFLATKGEFINPDKAVAFFLQCPERRDSNALFASVDKRINDYVPGGLLFPAQDPVKRITMAKVDLAFRRLDQMILNIHSKIQIDEREAVFLCNDTLLEQRIRSLLDITEKDLTAGKAIICYSEESGIWKDLSPEELYLFKRGSIGPIIDFVTQSRLMEYQQSAKVPYTKVVNDRETAIIGVDKFQMLVSDGTSKWSESKSVTSKIGGYTKLDRFVSKRYADELLDAKSQLFAGINTFDFDKKCNSCLGYCVEYYSKHLVYGNSYLYDYVERAAREADIDLRATYKKDSQTVNGLIVRACLLKYREQMIACFGIGVGRFLPAISANMLINEKYHNFVNTVVELGSRTAEYVKRVLYANCDAQNTVDANLTVKHIAGLADYITNDTILDVKVRNNIDEKCVRQVLAYHYLSTKRSDLNIKRVIVYDAVSSRSVVIKISEHNLR
jgi:hypothetical protein